MSLFVTNLALAAVRIVAALGAVLALFGAHTKLARGVSLALRIVVAPCAFGASQVATRRVKATMGIFVAVDAGFAFRVTLA